MTAGAPGDRPLTGVTVVVTRPIDQADALADLLAGAGALPIVMPLIELVDVASADEVAAAIGPLGADDWVVVASAHAASRVRGALTSSPARVAAVGATTARSLPRTDLVAEQRLSQPTTTVARPDGGGYFMRVRATDDDGFVGPFTRPQRIEIPPRPWPWWPLLLLLPALI